MFVFGKQTDTEALLQPLNLLTTPVTGVTGSNENPTLRRYFTIRGV